MLAGEPLSSAAWQLMADQLDDEGLLHGMQEAVMDKPVVEPDRADRTYDFNLNWTPTSLNSRRWAPKFHRRILRTDAAA